MSVEWAEVEKAKEESRHELVLTGEAIATRITHRGLDERIFTLTSLNFLEISKCGLQTLPPAVDHLINLYNLVLHGNRLRDVPVSIGHLSLLKFLDLSSNELESLPSSLGSLRELHTLNVSKNQLTEVIDPSAMISLHILDVSHNCLTELPVGICCAQLNLLSTILANNNKLEALPEDLVELPSLKLLDVTANKLTEIPPILSECAKLKEFKFGSNPLKDKRLLKMMNQCSTKACLDYLRNVLEKDRKSGKLSKASEEKRDKKKRGGKAKGDSDVVDSLALNLMKVVHFNTDESFIVQVTPEILAVRPYIVCCVVRNLNFSKSRNMMRRFITLQTKLHDGVCAKRQAATIATHDLEAVKWPLTFDARPPAEIKLIPLLKRNEKSAAALVAQLRREAEELRKDKKRSTVSGIHKYLELLKGKTLYPCLVDSSGVVISFPPITNSDVTKVTKSTRHVLVEVTSSTSLEVCKKVMEELVRYLLEMGIGQADLPLAEDGQSAAAAAPDDTDAAYQDAANDDEDADECLGPGLTSEQVLVAQQVKVIDSLGGLRVLFPSRVDLQSSAYRVIRDYE